MEELLGQSRKRKKTSRSRATEKELSISRRICHGMTRKNTEEAEAETRKNAESAAED
ncbi:MAG: hypothetical protein ACOYNM_17320 [Gemmataceae bacterium]